MTAQQLKNSILQMAVQGKLVPQNPDDEPASVLLERIRAEKQKLIKEGKIKKDKKSSEIFRGASRNLPYAFCEQIGKEIRDISDEIPFEIPDSWEWVRLSYIGEIVGGGTPKTGETSYWENGDIPWLTPADMKYVKWKYVSGGERFITEKGLNESSAQLMPMGTVLYSSRAPIGYIAIAENDISTNQGFKSLVPFLKEINLYAYYCLIAFTPDIQSRASGTTFKEISGAEFGRTIIPLPSLSEQHRIVAKIEELLPYIEKYGKTEEHLTVLNTTFPKALKKSILQEAVQGKLVPQNPDDEPASVLLERIRAEKQKLIKEGKIKKDKHESVIITRDKIPYEIIDGKERCIADEVPFEIPESWCWCRLKDLSSIITKGSSPKWQGVAYVEKDGVPFITSENVGEEQIFLNKTKYVESKFNDMHPTSILQKGDILTNIVGASIGRTAVFNIDISNANINQAVCIVRLVDLELGHYLVKFMNCPVALKMMTSNSVESARANLSLSSVGDFLIPLPPLAEQHRIVTKIEELMPFITAISK